MQFYRSDTYPECNWTDSSETHYQSKLLLIEVSDGTFELGFCIGHKDNPEAWYVDRKYGALKALAWTYVQHSEFFR